MDLSSMTLWELIKLDYRISFEVLIRALPILGVLLLITILVLYNNYIINKKMRRGF